MKYHLSAIPYEATAEQLDSYLLQIGCYCTVPPWMHIDERGEPNGAATIVTEMHLQELQQRLSRRDAFQGRRLHVAIFHRKAE